MFGIICNLLVACQPKPEKLSLSRIQDARWAQMAQPSHFVLLSGAQEAQKPHQLLDLTFNCQQIRVEYCVELDKT